MNAMMNAIRKVSVVVPVFNEEDNVFPLVQEIRAVMYTLPYDWELCRTLWGSSESLVIEI